MNTPIRERREAYLDAIEQMLWDAFQKEVGGYYDHLAEERVRLKLREAAEGALR